MPKFISIQNGGYLVRIDYIVSVNVTVSDSTDLYYEITDTAGGKHLVVDKKEIAKLMASIEVA